MKYLFTKTFFKFLFGFIAIVTISFMVITGTSYLAGQDIENNTAEAIHTER